MDLPANPVISYKISSVLLLLKSDFSQAQETFCSIQCGKCIIVNDRIFFPMFLTGFTNHLLITFHLRRCQYHIKVINDLRQFCITVGFPCLHHTPWAFPCFSCPRCNHSAGYAVSTNKQNPHYIIPFLCYIFDEFIIHYFQTYIYPPSFLPTRKGMD